MLVGIPNKRWFARDLTDFFDFLCDMVDTRVRSEERGTISGRLMSLKIDKNMRMEMVYIHRKHSLGVWSYGICYIIGESYRYSKGRHHLVDRGRGKRNREPKNCKTKPNEYKQW
jgi:hypothetical protein